jgi:[ribosomal protein S18]-alanine N-acetyltransferase
MENIVIRPATDPEKEAAARLLAGSDPWITLGISLEQCMRNCRDPEYVLYVASAGEGLAGIMLLDPRGLAGSPYLKSIAVFPEFAGKGIGSDLLSYGENLFRGSSRHFFLCVSSFNHKARRFYEHHGYEAMCEFRDYIIEGASEILMHKNL